MIEILQSEKLQLLRRSCRFTSGQSELSIIITETALQMRRLVSARQAQQKEYLSLKSLP